MSTRDLVLGEAAEAIAGVLHGHLDDLHLSVLSAAELAAELLEALWPLLCSLTPAPPGFQPQKVERQPWPPWRPA